MSDEPQVSYSIREVLERIETKGDRGFAELKATMSGKADKADVARMEARLDSHAERIGSLEQVRREEQAVIRVTEVRWSRWQRIGAIVTGAAVVLGAIATALAAFHVL